MPLLLQLLGYFTLSILASIVTIHLLLCAGSIVAYILHPADASIGSTDLLHTRTENNLHLWLKRLAHPPLLSIFCLALSLHTTLCALLLQRLSSYFRLPWLKLHPSVGHACGDLSPLCNPSMIKTLFTRTRFWQIILNNLPLLIATVHHKHARDNWLLRGLSAIISYYLPSSLKHHVLSLLDLAHTLHAKLDTPKDIHTIATIIPKLISQQAMTDQDIQACRKLLPNMIAGIQQHTHRPESVLKSLNSLLRALNPTHTGIHFRPHASSDLRLPSHTLVPQADEDTCALTLLENRLVDCVKCFSETSFSPVVNTCLLATKMSTQLFLSSLYSATYKLMSSASAASPDDRTAQTEPTDNRLQQLICRESFWRKILSHVKDLHARMQLIKQYTPLWTKPWINYFIQKAGLTEALHGMLSDINLDNTENDTPIDSLDILDLATTLAHLLVLDQGVDNLAPLLSKLCDYFSHAQANISPAAPPPSTQDMAQLLHLLHTLFDETAHNTMTPLQKNTYSALTRYLTTVLTTLLNPAATMQEADKVAILALVKKLIHDNAHSKPLAQLLADATPAMGDGSNHDAPIASSQIMNLIIRNAQLLNRPEFKQLGEIIARESSHDYIMVAAIH